MTKKVLFYTQNRWAFGSVHHGLCKELYKNGIYANLLDWTQRYTLDEFKFLHETYDIFVTHPDAVASLNEKCGISLEKIISIAHGQWDILLGKQIKNDLNFYKLRNYAVISEILQKKSIEFGINRIPNIVKIGIHSDIYKNSISNNLENIGYAGMSDSKNFYGKDIKRGFLVQKVAEDIKDIKLITPNYVNHFCMPSFYKKIDCVIMSSCEEGAGLPMMEAAAAGKLTIGTPVGYYEEDGKKSGGVVVDIEEDRFIEETKEAIIRYKADPILYKKTCRQIQEYAIENFDWSKRIESWINLLES